MLLTSAYCPPISWFALVARDFTLSGDRVIPSKVVLEASENYRKQSYRTRCRIAAAGGVETISVPIVHDAPKMPILSVRIDYSTPWLVRNQRAIDSAYRTSAWFDYYRDSLYNIMDSGEQNLFAYNLSLIRYFLEKTGIKCDISLTETFAKSAEDDFRYAIDPKKPDTVLRDLGIEKPYFQVFSGKYGFKENLSIMDLLFNEGPDSLSFLKG